MKKSSWIILIILFILLILVGFYFINKFFILRESPSPRLPQIFEQMDQIIKTHMGETVKMYIVDSNILMHPRTSQIMGIGIRNKLGKDDEFYLKVKSIDNKSDISWIEFPKVPQYIGVGDYKTIIFNVKVPATAQIGTTYMYSIEAYTKSQLEIYDYQILTVAIK